MVLLRLKENSAADRVVLFQHGPFEDLLRTAGVDVCVLGLGSSGQALRKESGLLRKAVSSLDVLRLARAVALAAEDMDVLYANTPKALVVAALASWIAQKPVVYHLHDILSREHFSRSNLWLLITLANRFVTHVIANSYASAQAFQDAGGRTETSVCYNGFDPGLFDRFNSNTAMHRNALRNSLAIGNGEGEESTIVGVFGRLAPWKGQHIAIEALKQLPHLHLVLVGDALFGESEYKQELIRLAEQSEIFGRVHFLGFRDDVAALMQGVDVVVHCSTAPEPFGRVIVEAMLSRRPIVASAAGGAEEIVQDGINGLLAIPGDPHDLAGRIREFLESDSERDRMIEAGYSSAVERFQLAVIVRKIEEIVASL